MVSPIPVARNGLITVTLSHLFFQYRLSLKLDWNEGQTAHGAVIEDAANLSFGIEKGCLSLNPKESFFSIPSVY